MSTTCALIAPTAPVIATSTASFAQPAVGSTVSVAVNTTGLLAVGYPVFLVGAGNYSVASITDSTHVVLTNLSAYNPAAGSTVATSTAILPGHSVSYLPFIPSSSNSGKVQMASSYTLTTTMSNIGLSATLAEAGTYEVDVILRCNNTSSGSSFGIVQLYNTTTSAVADSSVGITNYTTTSVTGLQTNSTFPWRVTTTSANNVIDVQAQLSASGSSSQIVSDGNGKSWLRYRRIY